MHCIHGNKEKEANGWMAHLLNTIAVTGCNIGNIDAIQGAAQIFSIE